VNPVLFCCGHFEHEGEGWRGERCAGREGGYTYVHRYKPNLDTHERGMAIAGVSCTAIWEVYQETGSINQRQVQRDAEWKTTRANEQCAELEIQLTKVEFEKHITVDETCALTSGSCDSANVSERASANVGFLMLSVGCGANFGVVLSRRGVRVESEQEGPPPLGPFREKGQRAKPEVKTGPCSGRGPWNLRRPFLTAVHMEPGTPGSRQDTVYKHTSKQNVLERYCHKRSFLFIQA
jgi:hypothetical protein